jgi:hypothetical protein
MTDPTITAALRAAAEAAMEAIGWEDDGSMDFEPLDTARDAAAAAIAAFLRALPDVVQSVPFASNSDGMMHTRQSYFAGDLAAAVEAAAHE